MNCKECGHSIDKHLPQQYDNVAGCHVIADTSMGTYCDCVLLPSDVAAARIAALTKALETSKNIIHDNLGGTISDVARERLWKDILQTPAMKQINALLAATPAGEVKP